MWNVSAHTCTYTQKCTGSKGGSDLADTLHHDVVYALLGFVD